MKAIIFFLLIGIITTTYSLAQEKPVQRPKVQIQKKEVQKQIITSEKQSISSMDSTFLPNFNIKSINELRGQIANYKALVITSEIERNKNNEGNTSYTTDNGVVLNALNAKDANTGSLLKVMHVIFESSTSDGIKNGIPTPLLQADHNRIEAEFKDLPTSPHLYLLTLGTSAVSEYLKICFFRCTNDGMDIYSVSSDQLITTPDSSEIWLLLNFNSCYDLQFTLKFFIQYEPPWNSSESGEGVYFNHLQLVQLD